MFIEQQMWVKVIGDNVSQIQTWNVVVRLFNSGNNLQKKGTVWEKI